mmetsp:Transcript_95654/g.309871  ORF Transcript_95654/g.309871 Transcript_95654/m.309871 type:complete len:237 (+) Transcript_95654:4690-5400(+)
MALPQGLLGPRHAAQHKGVVGAGSILACQALQVGGAVVQGQQHIFLDLVAPKGLEHVVLHVVFGAWELAGAQLARQRPDPGVDLLELLVGRLLFAGVAGQDLRVALQLDLAPLAPEPELQLLDLLADDLNGAPDLRGDREQPRLLRGAEPATSRDMRQLVDVVRSVLRHVPRPPHSCICNSQRDLARVGMRIRVHIRDLAQVVEDLSLVVLVLRVCADGAYELRDAGVVSVHPPQH